MKTINDLKENKSEIIERIISLCGESKVKEVMEIMVESIGCNVYFDMNAIEFTDAIIQDNNIPFKQINAHELQCKHQAANGMITVNSKIYNS